MSSDALPWYIRVVIGLGAWVTAIVLMLLGGALAFLLLEFREPFALSLFGAVYLAPGLRLLRDEGRGVFAEQMGLAMSAAGSGMIAGGIAAQSESLWAGLVAALVLLPIVIAFGRDRILQFLVAALAAGFYAAALFDADARYVLDLMALATPVGLYLYFAAHRLDLTPTATALLLAFPVVSVFALDDFIDGGGVFARWLHLGLLLVFAGLLFRYVGSAAARTKTLVVAIVAVAVCLLLPPGGSAAMLLLMFAFVAGSRAFAAVGALFQAVFIVVYYYRLETTLLNKSMLMMGVGVLLLAAWWFLQRGERRGANA